MDELGELVPVENDGVKIITAGTVAWLAVLLVLIPLHGRLERHGHLWWIACAATGFGLGLLGIGYCLRRSHRIARRSTEVR